MSVFLWFQLLFCYFVFFFHTSCIDILVLFTMAFLLEIVHQPSSLEHGYFFSSFLFFPLLNTILLVFNQINTGKWFSQYSSSSWTWCFIQSFTFLSLLYFPLRSTHRKYNPFKLICWMCVSWEKGFLGNTKYGTLLCLSAHQLVDWQLFPCRNNLFQNGICIVNSTTYRK